MGLTSPAPCHPRGGSDGALGSVGPALWDQPLWPHWQPVVLPKPPKSYCKDSRREVRMMQKEVAFQKCSSSFLAFVVCSLQGASCRTQRRLCRAGSVQGDRSFYRLLFPLPKHLAESSLCHLRQLTAPLWALLSDAFTPVKLWHGDQCVCVFK